MANHWVNATVPQTYPKELIQTPLNKLSSLEDVDAFLRQGITIEQLQSKAQVQTAYFSDRGRSFQRDRGRRFRLIVDAQGCAQARK
jgi:hypothetical protein